MKTYIKHAQNLPRFAHRALLFAIAVAVLLLAPAAVHAQGPQYNAVDLGTLGGNGSGADGVNNLGQVTGSSYTIGLTNVDAFLYSSGSMHNLGTLGGVGSNGVSINDSGQVAGHSTINGTQNAFLYSSGSMHDLGVIAGNYSIGYGVNASGQVTGYSTYTSTPGGVDHAFLYSSGSMQDLGTLGGSSEGAGINNAGQVTGQSLTSGGSEHAFLYSSGSMRDLGTLGGSTSFGYAINNSGQITGYAQTSAGMSHAFIYSSGSMHDLGTLGGSYSFGYGINDSGQVTGYSYTTGNSATDAFIYTSGTMYDLDNLLVTTGITSLNIENPGNSINNWGQIAADGVVSGTRVALLLNPVNPYTTVNAGVQDVKLVAGMNYTKIAAFTNTTGIHTQASFLDGAAAKNRDVQLSFSPVTAGLKSDIAQVGITTPDGTIQQDNFVLSLSYTPGASGAYLEWFNPNTSTWENAVLGNTDGGAGANFVNGAYTSSDDVLGDYGINTANNTVWAVVDNTGEFAVAGQAIPEPSARALLGMGAAALFFFSRRSGHLFQERFKAHALKKEMSSFKSWGCRKQ